MTSGHQTSDTKSTLFVTLTKCNGIRRCRLCSFHGIRGCRDVDVVADVSVVVVSVVAVDGVVELAF